MSIILNLSNNPILYQLNLKFRLKSLEEANLNKSLNLLPRELIYEILKNLSLDDFVNFCETNTLYSDLCEDPYLLKIIAKDLSLVGLISLSTFENMLLIFNSKYVTRSPLSIKNKKQIDWILNPVNFNKIKLIFQYGKKPKEHYIYYNILLIFGIYKKYLNLVKLLLEDPNINPIINTDQINIGGIYNNNAIILASEYGRLEIVKLLLADKRINPADRNNDAIIEASGKGHLEIVRLLLADPRVNPAALDNKAIIWASRKGHLEIVQLLLANPRVNPADKANLAIKWAILYNHKEIIKLLLTDPRVDSAVENNAAIIGASDYGHLEIVKSLLADPRVNPAALDNEAIILASEYGYLKIVQLLLEDIRVNPADQNNKAIILASEKGHLEIVKLLLTDKRVDPSDQHNLAIISAIQNKNKEERKYEYEKIIYLLLANDKVNPEHLYLNSLLRKLNPKDLALYDLSR